MIDRILEWMGDEQVQREVDALFAIAGGVMIFAFCLLMIEGVV